MAMTGQIGVWSITDRLAEILAQGDPLETLTATADFRMFRPVREYLVRDRPSWMRFCQLGPKDPVPDANTLCG
jgi:transposase, IS5 family